MPTYKYKRLSRIICHWNSGWSVVSFVGRFAKNNLHSFAKTLQFYAWTILHSSAAPKAKRNTIWSLKTRGEWQKTSIALADPFKQALFLKFDYKHSFGSWLFAKTTGLCHRVGWKLFLKTGNAPIETACRDIFFRRSFQSFTWQCQSLSRDNVNVFGTRGRWITYCSAHSRLGRSVWKLAQYFSAARERWHLIIMNYTCKGEICDEECEMLLILHCALLN